MENNKRDEGLFEFLENRAYEQDYDDYENCYDDYPVEQEYPEECYSEFGGIYDLSDDFINDVLEGDPDMYWNID